MLTIQHLHRFVWTGFIAVLVPLLIHAQDSAAKLQNLTAKKKLGIEQIKLQFNGSVISKGHFLKAGGSAPYPRYYIDFSKAVVNQPFPLPSINDSYELIKNIRIAQKDKTTVRVVFDLPQSLGKDHVVLEHRDTELTVYLARKATDLAILQLEESGPVEQSISPSKKTSDSAIKLNKPKGPAFTPPSNNKSPIDIEIPSSQEVQISPMKQSPRQEKEVPVEEVIINPPKNKKKSHVIIIDAGHGGEDSGARGPFYKTYEKDVTLSIAKRLKNILDKDSKYSVLMTREKDEYLQLWDRTNFANKHGGDLFVSIHANANKKHTANGVSTYFLHNADDEESLRVAMRENGELAVPKSKKKTQNDAYFLEVMKASMLKNFHTVQSTDLARVVQNSLFKHLSQKYSKVYNRGVKSARFYVLTGANMPAILVETSFITNKLEEKRLRSTAYQYQIALAVYRGIQSYFKQQSKGLSHARIY